MKRQMLLALLLGAAAISTSVVQAAVRVEVPPGDGIPAYARTDFIIHNEESAVFVFYRQPEYVPEEFNLLDFFDAPAALGAPLTVAGHEIWENGPPPMHDDPAPMFSYLRGLGHVPVWFVSWPELQEEIADGVLTIADLKSMASLQMGEATFFAERLHPFGNYNLVAHGFLLDGSYLFKLTATGKCDGCPMSVNIRFK